MKDQFGTEIKNYKDYLNQTGGDVAYEKAKAGKYLYTPQDFIKWETKRLYKDEEGNYDFVY